MFSNKVYDVLKWVASYLLPALATLYFALSGIWGLPYGEQIPGTIMAIVTALGLMLGISTKVYMNSVVRRDYPLVGFSASLDPHQPVERLTGVLIRMSGETYDAFVWIARYAMPAGATLVFLLSGIWNFAYGTQIVGTIAALNTFLNVILGVSTTQYKTEIARYMLGNEARHKELYP